ncbi:hypothetical protein NPIL_408041 [Nephila pilipes]|uniref:Uncharacterized protein n=1 Tax=Nephila pilipes TaxID=299642 RepID=A0A8X6PFC8_NEPPI|nr:hypothetical protein NPIL_408041 [Nephila pilipes]
MSIADSSPGWELGERRPSYPPVSSNPAFQFLPVLSRSNDTYSHPIQPIGSRRDYVIRLCAMSANRRKEQFMTNCLEGEIGERRDREWLSARDRGAVLKFE